MPTRLSIEEHAKRKVTPGANKQLVIVDVGDFWGKRKKAFVFDPNGPGASSQYEDDFYWLGTIRGTVFLSFLDHEIVGSDYDDLVKKIKVEYELL